MLYKLLLLVAFNSSVEQDEHMLQAGVVQGILCHHGCLFDRCQRLLCVNCVILEQVSPQA